MTSEHSSWVERLFWNLLSYSIVLVPIAFIVIITKRRLCPSSFLSSTIIQWFVYGGCDSISATPSSRPGQRSRTGDDERSLLDEKEHKSRVQPATRLDGPNKTEPSDRWTFLFCLVGLMGSYSIWGLLQEKIMTTKYPVTSSTQNLADLRSNASASLPDGTSNHHRLSSLNHPTTITFHDSQFLVFVNRIVAFIMAILALVISKHRQSKQNQLNRYNRLIISSNDESTKPQAPLYEYIYCSLSNILSSWCQYEALKYINFPTQCLSKSCKVIPVMLMSKVLLHKKYPYLDYFCAFLLALGMFVFMLNQPIQTKHQQHQVNEANTSKHHHAGNTTIISGFIILALYLTFDSFTSNWQQSLYGRYAISNWQMMAAVNFYSILLTLTSLHQLDNLRPALRLMAASSVLLRDLMLMSIMSSVGQMLIYYTIKRFGSVVFSVIMTLRQFMSILLSCALYGHQLNFGSDIGLMLVFLVVSFQVWHKSRRSRGINKLTPASENNNNKICIQFNPIK